MESGQSQYGLHFKKTQNVTERFLGYGEVFCSSLRIFVWKHLFFNEKQKENAKCQPIRQTSYFYVDIKYLRPSRDFKELKRRRLYRIKSSRGSRLAGDKSGSSSYLSPLKLDHSQNVVRDTILCKAHFFALKCTNSLSLVLPFTHAK